MSATSYTIVYLKDFSKMTKGIASKEIPKIQKAINELASNPFPYGFKALRGSGDYRIRIGDYRVIYSVDGNKLVILVIRIRHRRDVYKDES